MTELTIVRHGVAVPPGTPDIADDDRPLTAEGKRKMKSIGRGLKRLGLRPDRIVTSPLPRARRTAEIVAEALGLEEAPEDSDALRAGNDAASLRDWLATRPETSLMIVGHNPMLEDLIGLLLRGASGPPVCTLRKGGVAVFRSTPEDPLLRLDVLARPRMFRRD